MSGTTLSAFTPGDLVVSVYGAANGSGTFTLDQASAITLQELTQAGAVVGSLALPQATTVVGGTTEYAVSGEYGSASEGALQLSGDGQSLAVLGYGVNAAAFDTAGATGTSVYGNAALGQSTSLTGGPYTPVARVVADIGYNGNVDTSTSLYNVYNTNNPRSVATVNGTSFYLSGQGVKGSTNQGVFLATDGASSATAIDSSTDTREAEIVGGQLYVSRDSSQGATNIASYGPGLPTSATAPIPLAGITGQVTLTAGQTNTANASAAGTTVNLSPQGFFFANATTLYIADSGFPKNGGIGDGGLQKWSFNGQAWTLDYTLSAGLNLVSDTATAGTTGLFGLTGSVSGNTVTLYATTSTAGELDQSYLYGITDTLGAATLPATESFTQLESAAPDSIIRGVAFAPAQAAAAPANTTVNAANSPLSGLVVSAGSEVIVLASGALSSATILSAGSGVISGSDTGSVVAHGGSETVTGSATGDQIDGIQVVSGAQAVALNEIVDNGGSVTVAAGSAVNTLVATGGILSVSGAAGGTVISGGTVVLATANAVLTGGVTFSGAGTLLQAVVPAAGAGDQAVISGFGSGDVVDLPTIARAGATLATVQTGSSTVATVSGGGTSASFIFNAGTQLALGADAGGGAEIVFQPPPTSNVVVTSANSPDPGLVISSGSTLTVSAGGTIVGATILAGGSATVAGTDSGSTISAGGSETLLGSANLDQVYGVQLVSAGTALVTNETVHSGGIVNDFLKGAILTGTVIQGGGTLNINGNTTASNTVLDAGGVINLQSPKANLTGTLTFSGGGTLEVTGVTSAGFGDLATINGFTSGATIDVTTIAPAGTTLTSAVVSGNTVETVTNGTVSQSFIFAGAYAPGTFILGPDSSTGVQISTNVPCYCRGTMILTDQGEVAVETLRDTDWVVTASGAVRPIKWIGRRAYGGRFAAGNPAVLPVVIRAGALGGGLPRRDLWVSPMHALFLDGLLIPARALVNGTTIVQAPAVDQVEYFHVELDSHDILLAEGAAAESFMDDDSRGMFHNAAEFAALYPDETQRGQRCCAPLVEDGPLLEPIWQRLAGRKAA